MQILKLTRTRTHVNMCHNPSTRRKTEHLHLCITAQRIAHHHQTLGVEFIEMPATQNESQKPHLVSLREERGEGKTMPDAPHVLTIGYVCQVELYESFKELQPYPEPNSRVIVLGWEPQSLSTFSCLSLSQWLMIFPGKPTEGRGERPNAQQPPLHRRSTRQIRLWKNYNDCHYSQSVSRGRRRRRMVGCLVARTLHLCVW